MSFFHSEWKEMYHIKSNSTQKRDKAEKDKEIDEETKNNDDTFIQEITYNSNISNNNSNSLNNNHKEGVISKAFLMKLLDYLFNVRLKVVHFRIADVQIMSPTAQFVQPMILNLQIGDKNNNENSPLKQFNIRACFINQEGKVKIKTLKFYHFFCSLDDEGIKSEWRDNSPILKINGITQPKIKSRISARLSMTMLKMPATVNMKIDGNEIKGVVGFSISLRDKTSAIPLCGPAS